MTETSQTTTETRTIEVDGRPRRYLITRPLAFRASAPLVLVLHGSNQTPEQIRAFTEPPFDTLASIDHAVVVYPEGYKKYWNDARVSTNFAARQDGYDDVAFLHALIDELSARGEVDPKRVFAVGYSLGGQMVNRLAHEQPQLLAGIAMIGATQPAAENFRPVADVPHPMPVLLVHGTKDPNVPYNGGMASLLGFRPRGLGMSAPDTARYWALRNGVAGEGSSEFTSEVAANGTRIERTQYAGTGKPHVTLYTVHGGGHVIPGTKSGPRIMGRTAPGLRTVDEVARFFGIGERDQ